MINPRFSDYNSGHPITRLPALINVPAGKCAPSQHRTTSDKTAGTEPDATIDQYPCTYMAVIADLSIVLNQRTTVDDAVVADNCPGINDCTMADNCA